MRLLADENCDVILIEKLRASGHDVLRVSAVAGGSEDEDVFQLAVRETRVLLTYDLDFGIISDRATAHPPAIVLMRLDPLGASARADIIANFLAIIAGRHVGKFFVIEPGSVRERLLIASRG